jgi:hypothetical protein
MGKSSLIHTKIGSKEEEEGEGKGRVSHLKRSTGTIIMKEPSTRRAKPIHAEITLPISPIKLPAITQTTPTINVIKYFFLYTVEG